MMKHPQTIETRDGVLHIRDVQGPKKMGTVEARLEAVEREVFRREGMVERGLSANQTIITKFTRGLKVDGTPLEDIVFTLNGVHNRSLAPDSHPASPTPWPTLAVCVLGVKQCKSS
ncbi:40S ribosomal protein S5-1 [Hordeum vulgare]|nr:40S ribosomal protein S5-1 [Hordeum vulgare]